jgi:predicted Rossmann fold flavoprotein
MNKVYDLVIIGGGAAGLFAGAFSHNCHVLILEKSSKPGIKLSISGSGRCNFTNQGNINEFIARYGDNGRFLKHALYSFDNKMLVQYFEEKGLKSYTDKNGKLFPITDSAKDLIDILQKECANNKTKIRCNEPVIEVEKTEDVYKIFTANTLYESTNLLIATGGLSYPKTGSNGDGYKLAMSLGHTVNATAPALTPLYCPSYSFHEIMGVSLQNCTFFQIRNGKKIRSASGDILFTHKGISGPGILDFSRYLQTGDHLCFNLINLDSELFFIDILKQKQSDGRITVKSFLKKYGIPASLVDFVLSHASVKGEKNIGDINKQEMQKVTQNFTAFEVLVEQTEGFNIAMVTKGGISLNEINPKTFESKTAKGLYFAGEVMDIDGDTGGYNIQAAFSTAFCVMNQINNKPLIL